MAVTGRAGGVQLPPPPPAVADVFGTQADRAHRFAELLATAGIERGVIGPGEAERMWERHLLNSAVIGEVVATGCRVLDVGSGAGLPGVPLALARPDLSVALLEPMARRVAWLREVVAELELAVEVRRGRAEDRVVARDWDVVTARAVAPLGRLAGWCLPLLAADGRMLALKGANAVDEVARDRDEVRRAGGRRIDVVQCGQAVVEPSTTVVMVSSRRGDCGPTSRRRKDR